MIPAKDAARLTQNSTRALSTMRDKLLDELSENVQNRAKMGFNNFSFNNKDNYPGGVMQEIVGLLCDAGYKVRVRNEVYELFIEWV